MLKRKGRSINWTRGSHLDAVDGKMKEFDHQAAPFSDDYWKTHL